MRAIAGLAVIVNIVTFLELLCTAGLPEMFAAILPIARSRRRSVTAISVFTS